MTADETPRGSRRWLLTRLALLGGGLFAGSRLFRELLDDDDAPTTAPRRALAGLELSSVWRTIPGDTDPADASSAIEAQLSSIAEQGRGGVVYLPPGEWTVGRAVRVLADDVTITGAGTRASRLRLADGVRDHVIEVLADGVTVERLTIVGNGAAIEGEGLGSGIRAGDNADHLLVRDVVIEDVAGYGIGLEPQLVRVAGEDVAVGGLFDHVVLRNVTVRGTGLDGIDFKNYDWDTDACPRESAEDSPITPAGCIGDRTFLRNISVTGIAQHRPLRDERGVDLRGQRLLQNIEVLDVPGGSAGVMFRRDVGGPHNGRGGHWSTLENFFISTQGPVTDGIAHSDLEGVEVHHGFVVADDEVLAL